MIGWGSGVDQTFVTLVNWDNSVEEVTETNEPIIVSIESSENSIGLQWAEDRGEVAQEA